MNKPASELIALADAIRAWQQNPATTYTPTNILRDHGDTIAELARLATPPAQPAPRKYCERYEKCQEGVGICHCEDQIQSSDGEKQL